MVPCVLIRTPDDSVFTRVALTTMHFHQKFRSQILPYDTDDVLSDYMVHSTTFMAEKINIGSRHFCGSDTHGTCPDRNPLTCEISYYGRI